MSEEDDDRSSRTSTTCFAAYRRAKGLAQSYDRKRTTAFKVCITLTKMNEEWDAWLRESVWVRGIHLLPRYKAIWRFVKHGLIPFITRHKYALHASPILLSSRIATGLFNNREKHYTDSDWEFGLVNTGPRKEDVWHWGHVISDEAWEAFWDTWGHWGDVSLDEPRGDDRRIDIRAYIWTQISLEQSGQTRVVNEHIGLDFLEQASNGMGGGMTTKSMDDTYLREMAESGEWGGYRR